MKLVPKSMELKLDFSSKIFGTVIIIYALHSHHKILQQSSAVRRFAALYKTTL